MKPIILVTNDDGIHSPGLWAAAQAASSLGDLVVVAPMYQQTGMGRSFPKGEDVGKIQRLTRWIDGQEIVAYGVHGSPAQAVAYGVLELCPSKPDLCVSGINYGENLGLSITCSGTLGACFEADSHGIPSIAFSIQADLNDQHSSDFKEIDWEPIRSIVHTIIKERLSEGFPQDISIFNVNIPNGATMSTEMRLTRQSRSNYSVFLKPGLRDFQQAYPLQTRLDVSKETIDPRSDIYAYYFDQVVSITPLTWDLSSAYFKEKSGSLREDEPERIIL